MDQIQQVSNQSENDDIPEKANFVTYVYSNSNFSYFYFYFQWISFIILFISPYYLTENSTNGSAVKWSRDTGGDT